MRNYGREAVVVAAQQNDLGGSPPRHATVPVALRLCADSFLTLACIQTPGALLDMLVRQGVGAPLAQVLKIWAVAIVLALLRRRISAIDPGRNRTVGLLSRHRGLFAVAGALLLACVLTASVPRPGNSRKVIADLGLALELPSRKTMDCSPTRGCHRYETNELGFRGPVPRRDGTGARVIAVVGDSHVYGIGVDEDETIPAWLERQLGTLGRDVRVGNAGMPGLAMVSFPSVIEYANRAYDPDLVVALVKVDDVDEVDHNTRMMSLDRSLLARVLYVLNLEIIYETGRLLVRTYFPSLVSRRSFEHRLDDMLRRCAGRKLLLATDLDDALRSRLADWIEEHPEVGWYSSWDSPDWHEAPRIPGDGHWTGDGNEVIAGTMTPAVVRMLNGESVRPRSSNVGH